MNKTITITIAIVLILAVGYIIYDKYAENQQESLIGAYQRGVADAAQSVVNTIEERVSTCQPISITEEIQLIDIRCLQGAEE